MSPRDYSVVADPPSPSRSGMSNSRRQGEPSSGADHTTMRGVFLRCSDPSTVDATSCDEANIYDQFGNGPKDAL